MEFFIIFSRPQIWNKISLQSVKKKYFALLLLLLLLIQL